MGLIIIATGRPSRHPAAVAMAAVGASQVAVPQDGSSSRTPDILPVIHLALVSGRPLFQSSH